MLSTDTPRLAPVPSSVRDEEIALAVAAGRGDPSARRALVERVLDRTRRVVRYLVGSKIDADDVVQIALLQILGSARAYRGECSLEFFATRIAVRVAMRELRRWRRRERPTDVVDSSAATGPGADEEAGLRRLRARLAAQLGKLSPERREAVVLHHVEGYGLPEIAEISGAPLNTVRDRLRIGRRQLRQRILADPEIRDWLKAGRLS